MVKVIVSKEDRTPAQIRVEGGPIMNITLKERLTAEITTYLLTKEDIDKPLSTIGKLYRKTFFLTIIYGHNGEYMIEFWEITRKIAKKIQTIEGKGGIPKLK